MKLSTDCVTVPVISSSVNRIMFACSPCAASTYRYSVKLCPHTAAISNCCGSPRPSVSTRRRHLTANVKSAHGSELLSCWPHLPLDEQLTNVKRFQCFGRSPPLSKGSSDSDETGNLLRPVRKPQRPKLSGGKPEQVAAHARNLLRRFLNTVLLPAAVHV